jgi:hypothetical protein
MQIQPIGNIQNLTPVDRSKSIQKTTDVEEAKKLSREDIIQSKVFTPEQKLEMLGIQKKSTEELAKDLVGLILDEKI